MTTHYTNTNNPVDFPESENKMKHEHQFLEGWRSNADQFGLILPAADGNCYGYFRECMVMGCHVVEYAERLVPAGNVLIKEDGRFKFGPN